MNEKARIIPYPESAKDALEAMKFLSKRDHELILNTLKYAKDSISPQVIKNQLNKTDKNHTFNGIYKELLYSENKKYIQTITKVLFSNKKFTKDLKIAFLSYEENETTIPFFKFFQEHLAIKNKFEKIINKIDSKEKVFIAMYHGVRNEDDSDIYENTNIDKETFALAKVIKRILQRKEDGFLLETLEKHFSESFWSQFCEYKKNKEEGIAAKEIYEKHNVASLFKNKKINFEQKIFLENFILSNSNKFYIFNAITKKDRHLDIKSPKKKRETIVCQALLSINWVDIFGKELPSLDFIEKKDPLIQDEKVSIDNGITNELLSPDFEKEIDTLAKTSPNAKIIPMSEITGKLELN